MDTAPRPSAEPLDRRPMSAYRVHSFTLAALLGVACGGGRTDNARPATGAGGGTGATSGASGNSGTVGTGGAGGAGGNGATGGTVGTGGAGGAGATAGTSGGTAGTPVSDASLPPRCSRELMTDLFDPGEVYVTLTARRGVCGGAIVHWNCPEVAVAGFPCDVNGNVANSESQIRPTEGRLLFRAAGALREFRCDACPYVAGTDWPADPLANDIVVPTGCVPSDAAAIAPRFLVAPSGLVLFECDGFWRDALGQIYPANLVHLGYGGVALTTTEFVDLSTGHSTPITGLPRGIAFSRIRAVFPDKFWVVQSSSPSPETTLWQIDSTGVATTLGTYPQLPPYVAMVDGREGALDKDGALYEFGTSQPPLRETLILRREVAGRSDVVYTGRSSFELNEGPAGLLTGP